LQPKKLVKYKVRYQQWLLQVNIKVMYDIMSKAMILLIDAHH